MLPVSVHRHGHLHLLRSHALGGGGPARDAIQQHPRRLVVGRGESALSVTTFLITKHQTARFKQLPPHLICILITFLTDEQYVYFSTASLDVTSGLSRALGPSFRDIWFVFIRWQLLTDTCLIPSDTV